MPHKAHFNPQSQSERISGKPELSNHFSGLEVWASCVGPAGLKADSPSQCHTRSAEDLLITAPLPLQSHVSAVATNNDRQGGTVGAQMALPTSHSESREENSAPESSVDRQGQELHSSHLILLVEVLFP
ncbi:unnamed protein product [Leuciscus chuanchicus]